MPVGTMSPSAEMTFLEHLEEFRRRIIVSVIAIGFFMLLSLSFGKPIELGKQNTTKVLRPCWTLPA